MVQYCRKCGKELEDDAEFCDECGFSLNDNHLNEKNDNKPMETEDKNEFIKKLPLILAIISIVVSIAEGLGTPMLMGWDNILMAMGVGVIGGLVGILLFEKLNEPLIAAVEFIAIGAIVFMFIGRFGEISTILFIITSISILYLKGIKANNKKFWIIPIITIVGIFILIIGSGALYQMNAENGFEVGNLTQNITNDGYGYNTGFVSGDIKVDADYDYLCVNVNYYDSQDKIIESNIGWNDIHPESGKTYKISSWYFDQKVPVKAEISVVDSSDSTTPLYTENITISTSSGV